MFPQPSPHTRPYLCLPYVVFLLCVVLISSSSYATAGQLKIQAYPPAGTVDIAYNTVLTVTGGTSPYKFSGNGLPAGLVLNTTTGSITGIPTTSETSSVNVTVTDSNSTKASLAFSITIAKSGTVSVEVAPDTVALVSGKTQQFTAKVYNSTDQSVTWSCSDGTITQKGLYTAPQVDQGTWTYRVTATSVAQPTKMATATAVVTPDVVPLAITTTSLPEFMAGSSYSQAVNVTGGKTPYHWKMPSGTLPQGITLTNSTGAIAGMSAQTGQFPFTIQVTDSSWPTQLTATQAYTLVGSSLLSVSTTILPQITDGSNYDASVVAVGGITPYQWSLSSGSLPAGISLNAGTGVISGTTQKTGTYTLTVKVVDSSSPPQAASHSYTVQAVQGQSSVADFYVATNGNDKWSGTLPAPNSRKTDGPFASISRAQTAVQALLQNSKGRTTPIQVLVRAGTYYLSAPLNFTSADSGKSTLQVNWGNYPNETPVISGAMRITNWTHGANNQWTATLPTSTQYFEQLFYNGQRRLRPRLGGSLGTFYRVASTVYLPTNSDPNCGVYMPGLGYECFDRFVYNPSDPISANWENLRAPYPQGDIELYDFEKWTASLLRIKSIDTSSHIVYLTGPTDQRDYYHGFMPGHRYIVENLKDALTQAGQWFLDRSKTPWTLTYLANSNENPPTDTVLIPQVSQVLVANNLQYVTFQGLTFEHDNWTVAALGYPAVTADQAIPGAFGCYNCSHVTLDGVTITQTTGVGAEFITTSTSSTTSYITVRNSAFYDIGAIGIRHGLLSVYTDTDANVAQFGTFENNVIAGVGRMIPGGQGIMQGDGHDNLYTHNEIYDGYHDGIAVCALGCFPGQNNSHGAFNNVISFNHIHDLGEGILDDLGAVYFNVDPAATGSQVLSNKIHDVSDASGLDTDGYGGQGVYLDENTANALVQNNLVYRVSGSLQAQTCGPQASGTPNNVVNNIFAYGRKGVKQEGCAPPGSGILQFIFTNNLVYWDRGSVQRGFVVCNGRTCPQIQKYESNMYCFAPGAQCALPSNEFFTTDTGGKSGSGQYFPTFSSWQTLAAEDSNSVVQNPGFKNPTYPNDDYTLQESPGVGFVVFDPSQAGRSNPVIPSPTVMATFPTSPFNPATDF